MPDRRLSYAIVGGADAAKFTINPTTGALAFVDGPELRGADRLRCQQRLRRHRAGLGRQRRDRHSGHCGHGDQPERAPDDHVERRRRHGGGLDCREHHGGDHGHGNRPRCRTDAELCDRRRGGCSQVHNQPDDGCARLRDGPELRGSGRLRCQQRLRRHRAGLGRQRRDRHSSHCGHGDQPERAPDDHVERRRRTRRRRRLPRTPRR